MYIASKRQNAKTKNPPPMVPSRGIQGLIAAGFFNVSYRVRPILEHRYVFARVLRKIHFLVDRIVYELFFAIPAVLLSIYHRALRIAGKDLSAFFPEGVWQYYAEFGLREDSGHHTYETTGFQDIVHRDIAHLNEADTLAVWVMASAWLVANYDQLLAITWNEYTYLHYLAMRLDDQTIFARWRKVCPYDPPQPGEDFLLYRRDVFRTFCDKELLKVSERQRDAVQKDWGSRKASSRRARDLLAFQHQMTILARLEPGEHKDNRCPIENPAVAIIKNGHYYIVDLSALGSIEQAQSLIGAMTQYPPVTTRATLDELLCTVPRRYQPALRQSLPTHSRAELERLQRVPIILNWDLASSDKRLADLRQGRRGIGDHAMTIFRASHSMVFDLSHVFFDGIWGMTVVEILTSQATNMAKQLRAGHSFSTTPPVEPLALELPTNLAYLGSRREVATETSAETTKVQLGLLYRAREAVQKHYPGLHLSINDLLVLERALFDQKYQPSPQLAHALTTLASSRDINVRNAGKSALKALDRAIRVNPALLIPIDANRRNPRERVYPTTFRNPVVTLLKQHQSVLEKLKTAPQLDDGPAYRNIEKVCSEYFAGLAGFCHVLSQLERISFNGESICIETLRLLAGLPLAVQRRLDWLANQFDVIHDVVKGQEVFSNVGQIGLNSSLRRFNTAKDDSKKQFLAWGIMTDAQGNLHISLRDVRPHVAALVDIGQHELAQKMTQDYLDAYADHLNEFAEQLLMIAQIAITARKDLNHRRQGTRFPRYPGRMTHPLRDQKLGYVFGHHVRSDDGFEISGNHYVIDTIGKEMPSGQAQK